MRSQPGGNRFVRPGGAGVGPGAIRAETGGDYVSVSDASDVSEDCDGHVTHVDVKPRPCKRYQIGCRRYAEN